MIPEIFTSTPIEAHIIALCMKVQTQFASALVGTPVVKVVFFGIALAVTIIIQFVRMRSRQTAAESVAKIIFHIVLISIALAFLGKAVQNVSFNSFEGPWKAKHGVKANAQFAHTLSAGQAEGLHWYVKIYKAFNSVTEMLTRVISDTFNDPSLKKDPTFLAKQLARTSLMSMGGVSASSFEALIRDCSDTKSGKVLKTFSSVRELFDLSSPDCAQLWNTFEQSISSMGDGLLKIYKPSVLTNLRIEFAKKYPNKFGSFDPNKSLKNIAIANAIVRYTNSRAGFSGNDINIKTMNQQATFSGKFDAALENLSNAPISSTILNIADSISGGNARTAMLKAEAAQKFNSFSSLIPAARGFIQGILAIVFVLAAASLGFGATKFMKAWLMALGTICFYKPVAILGYKIAEYFTYQAEYVEAISKVGNDPLLLGGVKIIQDQLSQIQTVYILFEIGIFATFLVGAIACFRPLNSMTNALGMAMISHFGSVATSSARRVLSRRPPIQQIEFEGNGGGVIVPNNNKPNGNDSESSAGAGNGVGGTIPNQSKPKIWDESQSESKA